MGTSTGSLCDPAARLPRKKMMGTLWGRLRDVGHTCFLNSTHKHIKLTLKGYYTYFVKTL